MVGEKEEWLYSEGLSQYLRESLESTEWLPDEPFVGKVEGAKIAKLNVDEAPAVAAKFGIMSIPTVILFEDGKVKAQIVGARTQKDYEKEFGL